MAPAFFFGLTLINVGPKYSPNMNLPQILGTLYLAAAPLGAYQLWEFSATKCGWLPTFQRSECETRRVAPYGNLFWVLVAFAVPALAAIIGWRVPY
jgi:hypothetical protein